MITATKHDYDAAMWLITNHKERLSPAEQAACNQACASFTCNEALLTPEETTLIDETFNRIPA